MGLDRPTVFVVGAGAHVEYGMPTGDQLLQAIVRGALNQRIEDRYSAGIFHACIAKLKLMGSRRGLSAESESKKFARSMGLSGLKSVDRFISEAPELKMRGVDLMAWFLLWYQSNARTEAIPRGWNCWLYNKLYSRSPQGSGYHKLDWKNITVVTFNYDVLLECHLTQMIAMTNQQVPSKLIYSNQIESDKVFHVYGQLHSDYYWDEADYCFKTELDENILMRSSEQIYIAEDRDGLDGGVNKIADEHVARIKTARERILNAGRLVFVGFGFNRDNLHILGVNDPKFKQTMNVREVIATGYGLGKESKRRIGAALGYGFTEGGIRWGDPQEDCVSVMERMLG